MNVQVISERCRVCGCTQVRPCMTGGGDGSPVEFCAWLDADHTLCSNIRCIAQVSLADLEAMVKIPRSLLA
jgi:hypothetical protein